MKLNIEELAREAGFGNYAYEAKGIFEAFSRLIVERCAGVCDGFAESSQYKTQRNLAMWCASDIRKLLEAE